MNGGEGYPSRAARLFRLGFSGCPFHHSEPYRQRWGRLNRYSRKRLFCGKVGFDLSDIVVASVQLVLWIIGLCFLGKRFSFPTLLGSLAFPAFYSLLLRTNVYHLLGLGAFFSSHSDSLSALLLAAIFGSGLSGIGVALTYLGDGSTAGTYILCFLIEKYASISQDLSGFVLVTLLILISFIAMCDWGLGMVGITSAVICAVAVRFLYVKANESVVCNVFTMKPELVNEFISRSDSIMAPPFWKEAPGIPEPKRKWSER